MATQWRHEVRRAPRMVAVVALGVFAIAAGPAAVTASAGKLYVPGASFGGPGTEPGEFAEPVGVAVNNLTNAERTDGDVYVVDKGNHRVERFTAASVTAAGKYEGQFDGGTTYEDREETPFVKNSAPAPNGVLSSPEEVAVDNSGRSSAEDPFVGDVYVTDTGHKVVDEFNAVGDYIGGIAGRCEKVGEVADIGEACPGSKVLPFTFLRGIAVDGSGDVWIYNVFENPFKEFRGEVDEFSDTGVFLAAILPEYAPEGSHGLAVGSGGALYIVQSGIVVKTTTAGTPITEFGANVNALAVVPSTSGQIPSNLLVDTGNVIERYGEGHRAKGRRLCEALLAGGEPCEALLEPLPGGLLSESYGIGVSASSAVTVYASERSNGMVDTFDYVTAPNVVTEKPTNIGEDGVILHGSVNPEGEPLAQCYFEYESELQRGVEKTVGCTPAAGEIEGTSYAPVSSDQTLEAQEVRSARLVAISTAGVAARGLVIAKPVVASENVAEVESSAALANARIAPNGLETCYRIEFGATTAYGAHTASSCIEAGYEEVRVQAKLGGLEPDTQYHFRVATTNVLGTSLGSDATFTTFAPVASQLPDGRSYEMVSSALLSQNREVYAPAGMVAQSLDPLGIRGIDTARPFQAAPDGEAIVYAGDPPPEGGNGSIGDSLGNAYLAKRGLDGGWRSADLDPPTYENGYVAFSRQLSVGVLESTEVSQAQLAAGAPAGFPNLYRRVTEGVTSEEPLIDERPPCGPANFGSYLNGEVFSELTFGGGNAGTSAVPPFSHLLFEVNAPLSANPTTHGAVAQCGSENGLYDWVGGHLYLVNIMPGGGGEIAADATVGRQGPDVDGFQTPETDGAVSADGSRIVWSQTEPAGVQGASEERPKALYVRENDTRPESPVEDGECTVRNDACTVQLDLAEPGMGSGGHGKFVVASSDGSRIFFTDEVPLTKDSSASSQTPDLYEYNLNAGEGERLTDLSVPTETGTSADVQGVVGISEDGSYVYFVADGVLGDGAQGKSPVAGKPNLYVRHDGAITFIATLAAGDGEFNVGEGGDGDWKADAGYRTAEVTRDGRDVVFMSRQPLTGYDNNLTIGDSTTALTEVFLYDSETGSLACTSCNPSGEPPVAPNAELAEHISSAWGSFLPVSESHAGYQPRVVSADGDYVFFDSVEPLVPQDGNGLLNVYEWERERPESSCPPRVPARQDQGCVFLLSGGQSTDNSYLVDASESGNDVFFVTRADLVKGDRSDYDELYDARVGGVEPAEAPQCLGTGCQGIAPAPPTFATPASVTFAGGGNLSGPQVAACAKGKRRSHGKCVKVHKPKLRHRGNVSRRGVSARRGGR